MSKQHVFAEFVSLIRLGLAHLSSWPFLSEDWKAPWTWFSTEPCWLKLHNKQRPNPTHIYTHATSCNKQVEDAANTHTHRHTLFGSVDLNNKMLVFTLRTLSFSCWVCIDLSNLQNGLGIGLLTAKKRQENIDAYIFTNPSKTCGVQQHSFFPISSPAPFCWLLLSCHFSDIVTYRAFFLKCIQTL